MNLGNHIRNLSGLNLTLFIRRTVATHGVSTRVGTISPILVKARHEDLNVNNFMKKLEKETCSLSVNMNRLVPDKTPILFMKDGIARTPISNPRIGGEMDIGIPFSSLLIKDFRLPNRRENNLVEPDGDVVEKKAVNIIQIRRKKMKKHRRKKRRRKYRVFYVTMKDQKKARKEKELMKSVLEALNEAENFNVASHIEENLEKLKWKPPQTRIRGKFAPQWVIKEYSEKDKFKKMLHDRMMECSEKL